MKHGKVSLAVLMMCLSLIASLAMSNSLVVRAEHFAQAIWIEPSGIGDFTLFDTFTIDVMVNVTDPPGDGTGLWGWDYKLFWNSSVINAVNITIHCPLGWAPPNGILIQNETGVWPDPPRAGLDYHWYAFAAFVGATPFTGVMSLCTYKFYVKYQPYEPEPDFVGDLDIQDDVLVDEYSYYIFHGTYDGQYHILSQPRHVGGIWIPVNTFGLLTPYIGLASTILVATVAVAVYVKRIERRKKK